MDKATHSPGQKTKAEGDRTAASQPEPPVDLSGQTVGDYLVIRSLGSGGMGKVYLAEQLSLKRKVALKIMKAELAGNAVALDRFKAEAEAVARITHPNIVQVYAKGELGGLPFMALEYVDGGNLRDYMARRGSPELLLAHSIMRQVAAALQRAGEEGIVHRDIKPDNILLARKGEVKVADFGLVRNFGTPEQQQPLNLTASGITLGTPLYMSPEQVQGLPLDPRTDMYSFGVTSYHMLAGRPPFTGQTPFDVALQHVQAEPLPLGTFRPDLPADLCAIVHKMMAKNPSARYQTGKELLRDLTRFRETLSGLTGKIPARALPPAQTQAMGRDEPHVPDVYAESVTRSDALSPLTPAQPASKPAASPSVSRTEELSGEMAVPRRRARSNPLPALAVTMAVLLALAGGAGLARLAWGGRVSTPPAPVFAASPTLPAAGGGDEPAAQAAPDEREQLLVREYQRASNPGKDPAKLTEGTRAILKLGLFYLERGDLAAARNFFKALVGNPYKVRAYTLVGTIGLGVTAALSGQPKDAHDHFRQAQRFLLEGGQPGHLLTLQPDFQKYIVQARDRLRQAGESSKDEEEFWSTYLPKTPKRVPAVAPRVGTGASGG